MLEWVPMSQLCFSSFCSVTHGPSLGCVPLPTPNSERQVIIYTPAKCLVKISRQNWVDLCGTEFKSTWWNIAAASASLSGCISCLALWAGPVPWSWDPLCPASPASFLRSPHLSFWGLVIWQCFVLSRSFRKRYNNIIRKNYNRKREKNIIAYLKVVFVLYLDNLPFSEETSYIIKQRNVYHVSGIYNNTGYMTVISKIFSLKEKKDLEKISAPL